MTETGYSDMGILTVHIPDLCISQCNLPNPTCLITLSVWLSIPSWKHGIVHGVVTNIHEVNRKIVMMSHCFLQEFIPKAVFFFSLQVSKLKNFSAVTQHFPLLHKVNRLQVDSDLCGGFSSCYLKHGNHNPSRYIKQLRSQTIFT